MMQEKLYNFLGEKMYCEFMAEYYAQNVCDDSFDEFCDRCNYLEVIIITAFAWGETKRGIGFWSKKRHKAWKIENEQ